MRSAKFAVWLHNVDSYDAASNLLKYRVVKYGDGEDDDYTDNNRRYDTDPGAVTPDDDANPQLPLMPI